MRKLTKASLSELAKSKEIISFLEQKSYVGGGTGESGGLYSYEEFIRQMESNQWQGGYVQGVSEINGQISYNGGSISYIGSDFARYGGGSQTFEGYSGGSMYDGGSHIYDEPKNYNLSFRKNANENIVSDYTRDCLYRVMDATGDYSLSVTSTNRSAHDQARIMYENILRKGVQYQKKQYSNIHNRATTIYRAGVQYQKKQYSNIGDQVIDVYNVNMSREQNIAAMESKIKELGPERVSRHCGDYTKINVMDVAISSVNNRTSFENALKANGIKYLIENDCYHLEIKQK